MGDGGGWHWLVRMEWRPAGWSVCLPLLISPCTIKSRSSLLALAHPGGPEKGAVRRLWCLLYRCSILFPGNKRMLLCLSNTSTRTTCLKLIFTFACSMKKVPVPWVARWSSGYGVWLATQWLRVQFLAAALSVNDLRQVVHTHVPRSSTSINCWRCKSRGVNRHTTPPHH